MLAKNWEGARDGVENGRFQEDEEQVWEQIAKPVADTEVVLENRDEVKGWETVVLAALALPSASGHAGLWMAKEVEVEDEVPLEDRWEEMDHAARLRAIVKQDGGGGYATSLIHLAAFVGAEELARWSIDHGGINNLGTGVGGVPGKPVVPGDFLTPMSIAIQAGHVSIVRLFLTVLGGIEAAADVYSGMSVKSILLLACESGEPDMVRMLLRDWGADPNEMALRGSDKRHFVLEASVANGFADIVALLLGAGARVRTEGADYSDVLMAACVGGDVEIVRMLLDAMEESGELDGLDVEEEIEVSQGQVLDLLHQRGL